MSGRPQGTQAHCRCGSDFELPARPDAAGALACPGCGANIGHDSTSCQYCDARLAIRACPRCFAMLFLGVEFCGACGAKANDPANALEDGRAAPRTCPRCRPPTRLVSQLVGSLGLDACTHCQGVFVDTDLLERLLAERRHESPDETPAMQALLTRKTSTARIVGQIEGIKRDTSRVYIQCPDCSGHMVRRTFGRRSGVIVDICKAHGTWFDADELDRVVAFVQDGGVDRDPNLRTSAAQGGADFFKAKKLNYGVEGVAPKRRLTGFFETSLDALKRFFDD